MRKISEQKKTRIDEGKVLDEESRDIFSEANSSADKYDDLCREKEKKS